jgi:deoxyribodipyrimidine photolyase-related protein
VSNCFCKSCHYDVKQKTGEGSCPFNSLYWDFVDRHKQRFERNPRMAMIYKNWQKQPKQNQQAILAQAKAYLSNIESL